MNDSKHVDLNGGCACGAIRYEFSGEPETPFACHCEYCQRQSSSVMMLYFITYASAGFVVTKGEAKGFASSDRAMRYYCEKCGTPLYFQYNGVPDRYATRRHGNCSVIKGGKGEELYEQT